MIRHEWVEDKSWRLIDPVAEPRRCRFSAGHRERCSGQGVAELKRGRAGWWAYCEEHLYGRRIRNGRVEFRRNVYDDEGEPR